VHSLVNVGVHAIFTPHLRQTSHKVCVIARHRFHSLDERRTMLAEQVLERTSTNTGERVVIWRGVDQREHQIPRDFRLTLNELVEQLACPTVNGRI